MLTRTISILFFVMVSWTNVATAQDESTQDESTQDEVTTEDTTNEEDATAEEDTTPKVLRPGVAVLDTGTNAPVNVIDGFNFLNGTTDTSDSSENNHGTTVSLIINQAAPDIPQYQYVVNQTSTAATNAALLTAAANPDIKVIAYSSAVIVAPSSAIADASAAGKLIAIRTGNNARANPDAAAVAAHTLPGVVVVTATNGAGGFLPNANACGVTAERCVGARGTTDFNDIFGTSFASARLAGIAAEVLRDSPFLTNEELAQVIFATAIPTGDERLGNGYVADAEQVINNPAGPTSFADGGSRVGGAAVVVGAAGGAALLYGMTRGRLEKTLVLDSFGRPFHVDVAELASIEDNRGSIESFFNSLEQRHESARIQIDDNHELQAAYVASDFDIVDSARYFAFDDDPAFDEERYEWSVSLSGEYQSGVHYQLNRNWDPSMNFGVMDTVYTGGTGSRSHFISGQAFGLPLLGFSSVADSVIFGLGGKEGFGFDFGVVHTDEDRQHGRNSVAGVVEGSYQFRDRAKISFQVGELQEDGNLFGGASNGAFSVDSTDTLAASISASLRVAGKTHLIGNYGVARSEVGQAEIGLLENFSTVHSDWFGVGLISDEVFSSGDQFGLAFSRPLRITGGEVDMEVPYARDFDGNIYSNTDRISLVPGGQEYTLESYYLHPLGQRSSLGAYVMLRRQPFHVEESGRELTVLASYRARF